MTNPKTTGTAQGSRGLSWSEMTTGQRIIDALDHCLWLALEKRHTTDIDPRFKLLEQRGLAIQIPGIMGNPRYFRVRLTDNGKQAAGIL